MKTEKVATYSDTTFTCTQCGTVIETRSTGSRETHVETCSNCHPAYTGKQREAVNSSRIDAFNNRYPT